MMWAEMTTAERTSAILAGKAEGKSYRQIGEELGTNKEAVGGLLFRQGYSKPNDREHAAVADNAHPLIKELFAHVDNRGIDSGSLVRRSGYSMETVYLLRTNPRGARLRTVADLGEAVGLKLVWVPK